MTNLKMSVSAGMCPKCKSYFVKLGTIYMGNEVLTIGCPDCIEKLNHATFKQMANDLRKDNIN